MRMHCGRLNCRCRAAVPVGMPAACEAAARCSGRRALQVSGFAAHAEAEYQAIAFAMRATAFSRFCIDVANEMRR
jgi:hypothetical protein